MGKGFPKAKFASVATLAVLALRSFPRKYNAGNTFICPQNPGFFKKKRAAEPPWRNENRGCFHTSPVSFADCSIFSAPSIAPSMTGK